MKIKNTISLLLPNNDPINPQAMIIDWRRRIDQRNFFWSNHKFSKKSRSDFIFITFCHFWSTKIHDYTYLGLGELPHPLGTFRTFLSLFGPLKAMILFRTPGPLPSSPI